VPRKAEDSSANAVPISITQPASRRHGLQAASTIALSDESKTPE
jgi:hypothetical protein